MKKRSVMFVMVRADARWTRLLDYSLVTLIVLSVVATILESMRPVEAAYGTALHRFDLFIVVVFTCEYVVRLTLCPEHPSRRFRAPIAGRLRFALTPMAIVDLLAILPFYLALAGLDLRFLRALRLVRIFKLTRYSSAMSVLLDVLREEASHFGAAIFVLVIILLLAASGMYVVEHDAQPEAFGSIPAAMWWAVATLTTVGYGDVTPVTAWGKLFGAVVTIVGVGMVALPAGLLASAFSDHLRRRRDAFRARVRAAVADGEIDGREREALEVARQDLGLAADDAAQIVQREGDAGVRSCPHCGKEIGRR